MIMDNWSYIPYTLDLFQPFSPEKLTAFAPWDFHPKCLSHPPSYDFGLFSRSAFFGGLVVSFMVMSLDGNMKIEVVMNRNTTRFM